MAIVQYMHFAKTQ